MTDRTQVEYDIAINEQLATATQGEPGKKIVGLIATFGTKKWITRVEVSVTIPAQRTILAHAVWNWRGTPDDDPAGEAVTFCVQHGAQEIRMFSRPLPVAKASTGRCAHCGGEQVRVPWIA
jgi:hypothetical protein